MRLIDADVLLQRLCGDNPASMEDYYYNAIKDAPTVNIKTEVARQIFEEIEKLKDTKYDWNDCVEWDAVEELKNKYTKEGVDG